MNIIEAIKSGKKFKRKTHINHRWMGANESDLLFEIEEILADDWEIEDTAIKITSRQFWDAYVKALRSEEAIIQEGAVVGRMAKILGL